MARLKEGKAAPDFIHPDLNDKEVHLHELLRENHVLLVLNRGFA